MRTVWCMITGCFGSWVLVALIVMPQAGLEVLLGMIAPLVVAIVSLPAMERTYKRDPKQLTNLMIQAFAGKFLLFGVYVTIVIGVLSLQAIPFVVSFTTYFVALHLMEALYLRRLFAN